MAMSYCDPLRQVGSNDTISDLTSAAGWTISGCIANSSDPQTVQASCDRNASNAQHCDHVLAGTPIHKIVRLPDSCGSGPFAHVASWTQVNSTDPSVDLHTLSFDYAFTDIPAGNSTVSFSIHSSTVPSSLNARDVYEASQSRKRSYPRRELAPSNTLADFSHVLVDRFSDSDTLTTAKIDFQPNKAITVVNEAITCGNVKESLVLTVNPSLHATVNTTFSISGTIFPPEITGAALTATMDSDLHADATINAALQGSITASTSIFTLALPGFDIPGIFSLGPKLDITAGATFTTGVSLVSNVTVDHNLQGLLLKFPPSTGGSSVATSTPTHSG
ncbi:hypothetical protein DL93DRAFT_2081003 [Clavulina sp. PMI_390]|nr:hypothetical protein DL93DRAFT_2081003 [Clavulina sp. PMI_390]